MTVQYYGESIIRQHTFVSAGNVTGFNQFGFSISDDDTAIYC